MKSSQVNIAELILNQVKEHDEEGLNINLKAVMAAQSKKIEAKKLEEKVDKRRSVLKGPRIAYIDRKKAGGKKPVTLFIKQEFLDKMQPTLNKGEWTRSDEVNRILEKYYNEL